MEDARRKMRAPQMSPFNPDGSFQHQSSERVSSFHQRVRDVFGVRRFLREGREKKYKIGEIAKACNVPRTTIRYYTQKGLISAEKGANGYHYYDFKTIVLVKFISMHANQTKLYLDGIKKLIEETPFEEIERQVREWDEA